MLDERSITWELAGDVRFLPFLGRAFLLQVAHPTIAAGVAQHSEFERDPWGRLNRSFGLVLRAIYASDGPDVGAAIRESHRFIGGVGPDGRDYHAFEPEAYFWVLATGAESQLVMAQRIGRTLSAGERARLYAEMLELGRRLGLRDRDMPPDPAAFDAWYAGMLRDRIERNSTVERVLAAFAAPRSPLRLPGPLWLPGKVVTGHAISLFAIGTLPEVARRRLGLDWSGRRQAQLDALCVGLRVVGRAPRRLRYLPPARSGYAR